MYEEEFKKDMLSLKVCQRTFPSVEKYQHRSLKLHQSLIFTWVFQVIPPVVYLRVTENVHRIVAFIEGIIRNGNAYATREGELVGRWVVVRQQNTE